MWRHTLHIGAQNPWLGTGPDTFQKALKDHLAQCTGALKQNFDTPHNMFLAILSNNGLPALLLFVGAMAAILLGCLRHRHGLPLGAAILCYLVQGIFIFCLCIVTPMFWAVVGIAMACLDRPIPGASVCPTTKG